MDPIQKIALYTAVLCLMLALLKFQVDRFTKARVRNVVPMRLPLSLAPELDDAREQLRALSDTCEAATMQIRQAAHQAQYIVKGAAQPLPVKTPRQTDRKPVKKAASKR